MLTGKVALITGAGRGIGAEIARAFASQHATVILNYRGSKEKAQAVADEIMQAGGTAEIVGCDVADFDAAGEMIRELVEKYGRIDILVNNAGITRDGLLMKMSEEDFDAVLSTNLKGTFHTIRHLSRYLLKQRSGKIINIASVSGILGNAGQANYSASKAGVIGLTKSVARELASRSIQVNAIAPGLIETDMTDAMPEKAREAMTETIPLKRMGKPQDIAAMAVFLASSGADYITGQVFAVDGGMSI